MSTFQRSSAAPVPFRPRQVRAMGPRWLLLSSGPNEEFHAFLADLLDQQCPLCPPPPPAPLVLPSGPPVRFPPVPVKQIRCKFG